MLQKRWQSRKGGERAFLYSVHPILGSAGRLDSLLITSTLHISAPESENIYKKNLH